MTTGAGMSLRRACFRGRGLKRPSKRRFVFRSGCSSKWLAIRSRSSSFLPLSGRASAAAMSSSSSLHHALFRAPVKMREQSALCLRRASSSVALRVVSSISRCSFCRASSRSCCNSRQPSSEVRTLASPVSSSHACPFFSLSPGVGFEAARRPRT